MKKRISDIWICPICSTSNHIEDAHCFVCDHLFDKSALLSKGKIDEEILEQFYLDALLFKHKGQFEDAKRKLIFAAECGHTKSIIELAKCYSTGEMSSIEKDDVSAYKWFLTAAKSDSSEAQLEVGKCYLKGIGTRKNKAHALSWIEKSIKQEYSPAIFYFADMLISGDEIDQDKKKGLEMYIEQGINGNTDSWYWLGMKYSLGDGLPQNDRLAAKFFKRAAKRGNELAMIMLASCYEDGTGVFKSSRKALFWKGKAKNAGRSV